MSRDYRPLYSGMLDRLQHLPIIRSAAMVDDIPLSHSEYPGTGMVRVVGRPIIPLQERPTISTNFVSPDFFQTLGIALKSGRIFSPLEFAGAPAGPRPGLLQRETVVVNEAFVRRLFPDEEALGQQLGFGPDELHITWTIVGVVANIRNSALGADAPAMIYRCTCAGFPLYRAGFILRTAVSPETTIRAVEQQIRAVDRDQPISDVKTMEQRRDAALAPERFQLTLFGCFAGIAIVLAAAGVYGTMSYLVTRRT